MPSSMIFVVKYWDQHCRQNLCPHSRPVRLCSIQIHAELTYQCQPDIHIASLGFLQPACLYIMIGQVWSCTCLYQKNLWDCSSPICYWLNVLRNSKGTESKLWRQILHTAIFKLKFIQQKLNQLEQNSVQISGYLLLRLAINKHMVFFCGAIS